MGVKPVLVLPFNDAQGIVWRSFKPIVPQLKQVLAAVLVGVPADTAQGQPALMAAMRADPFFAVLETPAGQLAGEYFLALYEWAARVCPPGQVLHLAFPDRVAFALGGGFGEAFLEDVSSLRAEDTPLLFARSEAAWATHPANYRQAEAMITAAGEMLFGKRLDFAWCHLAIQAGRLASLLPTLTRRDMSLLAEMVAGLVDEVQMHEVDWLAWEDPFILEVDGAALKAEREGSAAQSRHRLRYAVPMMEVLLDRAV
ncbi:MAG: hypothetical protein JW987_15655 [Anaerolineaceae bacterium]|nr:hypothetical protein [Anaerolineaceae bacterium]